MRKDTAQRPLSVNWALALFWVTIVLGITKLLFTLMLPAGPNGRGYTIFAFIVIYALIALNSVYLAMGAAWSRKIMLILVLIGIVPAVPLVLVHFSFMPVLAAMTCVQGVACVVGLYLVFREPAATWFGKPLAGSA